MYLGVTGQDYGLQDKGWQSLQGLADSCFGLFFGFAPRNPLCLLCSFALHPSTSFSCLPPHSPCISGIQVRQKYHRVCQNRPRNHRRVCPASVSVSAGSCTHTYTHDVSSLQAPAHTHIHLVALSCLVEPCWGAMLRRPSGVGEWSRKHWAPLRC